MGRRRTSNAPVIGAIVFIGLVGWVLSKIWLYLVIGAAVVFGVWLARTLLGRAPASSSPPRPPSVAVSTVAAPRPEPFRALLPIDPRVFDEPARARAAALDIFAAWVRQLPMAPEDPAEFVHSVEIRQEHFGRLATTLVERQLVAREAPHHGPLSVTAPRLELSSVDAWAFSAQSLRSASLYVSACAPCEGTGRVACAACRGSLRIECPGCKGERKAYGHASNGSYRLMNCKQCGAKGQLPCTTCVDGKVACPTCEKTGRIEHWIALTETSRQVVQVAGYRGSANAFGWDASGPRDSSGPLEADARRLGEVSAQGVLGEQEAARVAPPVWLRDTWQGLQPEPRPGERVQGQTLQVYELPSAVVSYALPKAPPTELRFEGLRMLAPPASADQQFAARARSILLVRRTFLALLIGVMLAYFLRGLYFWSAWVGAMAICLAAAGAAGERFMREVTLGRVGARRWAAASASAVLLCCAMAVGAEPSLSAARLYLSMGRLEQAQTELTLVGAPEEESHARVWADYHLAHALASGDLATVADDAASISRKFPQRASAEQRLYELTQQVLQQHLSKKDLTAARAALIRASAVFLGDGPDRPFAQRLGGLKAQLAEAEFPECPNDVCRWRTAFESAHATPSDEREKRLAAARAKVVDSLNARPRAEASALSRLVQIDASIELAGAVLETPGDEDLTTRARTTAEWALGERQKIPLIGSEKAVVTRLLGFSAGPSPDVLRLAVSSVELDCRMKDSRCVGVYLVGGSKETRVLNDPARAQVTADLLSRALGHPVTLPSPPNPVLGKRPTSSRAREGGVTVVSRWRDTSLMELRVGEVDP